MFFNRACGYYAGAAATCVIEKLLSYYADAVVLKNLWLFFWKPLLGMACVIGSCLAAMPMLLFQRTVRTTVQ